MRKIKSVKSVVEKQHQQQKKKSGKTTQNLISHFHTLLKRKEKLKKSGEIETHEFKQLETELEELGGLPAYQIASLKGGSKDKGLSGCGKWLLCALREVVVDKNRPLKMLDVGAITGEVYEHEKSLDVTSIDLHSYSPLVEQQDFFERPIPINDEGRFYIIGLSLVLNFLPDPVMRGEMLKKTVEHLLSRGLLFIVLPLPCINNSRYLTHDLFIEMLQSLGFALLKHHHSKKLAYYLFELSQNVHTNNKFAKKEVAKGKKRNNFSIILD